MNPFKEAALAAEQFEKDRGVLISIEAQPKGALITVQSGDSAQQRMVTWLERAKTVQYITGFLHSHSSAEKDYGYGKNHLPQTSGKARSILSSLDLIKK